ncbi:peptidylprolyl isomerase [Aurantiacibacter sediminis]|uniref:peptidylprolyl isomerase n=1 Tax=Aurantiacibacter sediminis TaxID=2793064 RepID=A0ABS0N3I7_9SPHN|nr:peptidylprolyl isomerase [Aurantiacibacter sediminis]MBH5322534.1 peptidylprolyl isomerase [Aurantiacibacter sediminis]
MFRTFALTAAAALVFTSSPAMAQEELQPANQAAEAANEQAMQMPLQVNFDMNQDRQNILFLDLSTGERVGIRLVPQWAPNHVERIKTLARQGFYNGVPFHRVIDGLMAQTGRGETSLPNLEEEFNFLPHIRGTVSMARLPNDNDSANSQFFIVFYPHFAWDRQYTNFGRVIHNMPAVDAIQRGEPPANPTRILQASIAADNIPQMMPGADAAEEDEGEITLDMLNGEF